MPLRRFTSSNAQVRRHLRPSGASKLGVAALLMGAGLLTSLVSAAPAASAQSSSWSIVPSPSTSATQDNELNGVSCVSASDCWAVGEAPNVAANQTLIEQWNGAGWAIVPSPNTSATLSNELEGISCVSASDCWAVGSGGTSTAFQTLTEQWNGTSWSIVPSPNTSAALNNELNSVSCVSASTCWAVGTANNGTAAQTLTEQWNGTSWSIVPSPSTSAALNNELNSVSCVSASTCWAVGTANNGTAAQTLTEQWNGTSWSIVPSPSTSATQGNTLEGISCVSASDCSAVGSANNGTTEQTLAEQWNGTNWSIVPSPTTTQASSLSGVTCVSASDCWAVGFASNAAAGQTLAEQWNGSNWSIVSSSSTSATQDNDLFGVSCVSASDCWAVGEVFNGTANQTLTLQMVGPQGYWLGAGDGGVFNFGANGFYGSAGSLHLNAPVVGIAPDNDPGYWLVATDGGIFNYGDAGFFGSAGGIHLNKPVVGMAATPDDKGYWLVASDGGIFNYGDAGFFGSAGAIQLNKPIVGMAATPDGGGYWLVASDGGIFSYGDAHFYGSRGGQPLNKPIVGMASSATGLGYWLVASDGGIFNYGDAQFLGSTGALRLNKPVVGMAATTYGDGVQGYWLVASDGGIFNYGNATYQGSTGSIALNSPVVGIGATG